MSDFTVVLKSSGHDPHLRSRALANVYREILSWPDPTLKNSEPAVDDLGRTVAAGSVAGVSADTDTTSQEKEACQIYYNPLQAPFSADHSLTDFMQEVDGLSYVGVRND